ncbi:alcohol dehydrogenase catalytic domain-containing protein [Rhodococcus sp. NPDC056960]|uniref:alcohol dehydrogenase catalytic domain-containing protein n=1 Tax=Rhodococcus sp. NPDC056960 TaxID=3345982 RepID=UPI003629F97B
MIAQPPSRWSPRVVLGHEIAGHVVERVDGVDRPSVGDLVVVHPVWSCDRCRQCVAGRENACLSTGGWMYPAATRGISVDRGIGRFRHRSRFCPRPRRRASTPHWRRSSLTSASFPTTPSMPPRTNCARFNRGGHRDGGLASSLSSCSGHLRACGSLCSTSGNLHGRGCAKPYCAR